MATLREIKKRITSIKNTGKITKAMKMVSASKLRHLQENIIQTRPYANHMEAILWNLSSKADRQQFPLLHLRPRKVIEVLLITSDRGLCGAFNAYVIKEANRFIEALKEEHFEVSLSVIGKKGVDFFKRRDKPIRKAWTGLSGKIMYSDTIDITQELIESYLNETYDELRIIYNEFKSALIQEVTIKKLLPIEPPQMDSEGDKAIYLYEPSEESILHGLLFKYMRIQVYRILLESNTSEEAARMVAMENATKNADELIDSLTLQFNKVRQASITKEMLDIIGGSEAIA